MIHGRGGDAGKEDQPPLGHEDARGIGHVHVGAAVAVMHDLDAPGHGRAAHAKMFSGRKAETIQLGASTISLILRSAATLHTM